MNAVLIFLDLARLEDSGTAVRRVEANQLREELSRLADGIWLDTPPVTRGNPEAWEEMMLWAAQTAGTLATGS